MSYKGEGGEGVVSCLIKGKRWSYEGVVSCLIKGKGDIMKGWFHERAVL